jgi:hypothetical protein
LPVEASGHPCNGWLEFSATGRKGKSTMQIDPTNLSIMSTETYVVYKNFNLKIPYML